MLNDIRNGLQLKLIVLPSSPGSSKTIPHPRKKPKKINKTRHSGNSLNNRLQEGYTLLEINTDNLISSVFFLLFAPLSFFTIYFHPTLSISSLYLFVCKYQKRYKLMPTPHIRQQYLIDKSIIFQKNAHKTCICSRKSLTSDAALAKKSN